MILYFPDQQEKFKFFAEFINGTTANGETADNTASFFASNAPTVTTPAVQVTAIATAKPVFDKYYSSGGAVGGYLTYGFQICNENWWGNPVDSTLDLTNITIVDTLPAGTTLIQVQNSASSYVYDAANHIITYTLNNDLAVGECEWPKVTIQMNAATYPVGSTISNTAWVNYTPVGAAPVSDPISLNRTVVNPNPQATTSKDVDSSSRYPGQNGTYTIDLEVDGTETLNNFCIRDTIPSDIEVTEISHGNYYYGGISGPEHIVNISYYTNLGGPYLIAGSPFFAMVNRLASMLKQT